MRLERGERVVGDLGLGRAHGRDQRRLARVREADERGVGQQLQLELQPPLLAVLALLGEARRAARVRQEARVAAPALPAARREPRSPWLHEVGEQLAVRRRHDRALGHVDDEVGAALAVLLLARAVRSRARLAVRMVAEREQRRDVAVRPQPDVAAAAAVAAVGTALRDVRLAPERDTARAAVATLHVASARHRRSRTSLTRIRTAPIAVASRFSTVAAMSSSARRGLVARRRLAAVVLAACSSDKQHDPTVGHDDLELGPDPSTDEHDRRRPPRPPVDRRHLRRPPGPPRPSRPATVQSTSPSARRRRVAATRPR